MTRFVRDEATALTEGVSSSCRQGVSSGWRSTGSSSMAPSMPPARIGCEARLRGPAAGHRRSRRNRNPLFDGTGSSGRTRGRLVRRLTPWHRCGCGRPMPTIDIARSVAGAHLDPTRSTPPPSLSAQPAVGRSRGLSRSVAGAGRAVPERAEPRRFGSDVQRRRPALTSANSARTRSRLESSSSAQSAIPSLMRAARIGG